MYKLLRLFKIIFIIWGVMLFFNAPELAIKIFGYAFLGYVIWGIIKSRYKSIVEKREAKKIEEYNNHMINANKSVGDQLAKQFNAPISKAINYGHERYIFISEVESLIMIDGITFSFSQLLSCDLVDDQRSFSTTTTIEKKKSSSFLDYMINTDAGRVVDAINAPVTRSVDTASKIVHDYTLKLTLDSLSSPYLTIRLGDDEETKDYLKGLFDVIIHRTQKNNSKERGN